MALVMIVAILLLGPVVLGSGLAWLRFRTDGAAPEEGTSSRGAQAAAPDVRQRRRELPPAA